MTEGTCKKIRESLSFEKSGEEVYVEIGMKNVPSKIKTKAVVDFLKTLFDGAIDQLEAPVIPDTGSKESARGVPAEDVREALMLSEKEFEKLMDNWIKKNKRAVSAENNTLQPDTIFGFGRGGGAPGPAISIPCPPKKEEV